MLAVSDRTAGVLTLIDPDACQVIRHIPLEGEPTGVAWPVDRPFVYVAEYNAASVAEIDPQAGLVVRRFTVGLRPIEVAVAPKSGLLLSANNATHSVSILDLETGNQLAWIAVPGEPFSITLTSDESLAVVSHLIPAGRATDPQHAAEISLIDLITRTPVTTVKLPAGSSSVRKVLTSADGRWAYVAHTVGRTSLPTTQVARGWINTNGLSLIDLGQRELVATLLLDHPMEGAADPWGMALDPDGNRLYLSISGGHQLARIELATLHEYLAGKLPDKHPLAQKQPYSPGSESIWLRIKQDPNERGGLVNDLAALHSADLIVKKQLDGKGPRGISLAPDGKRLAIGMYYSGSVLIVDTASWQIAHTISLGQSRDPDLARLGELIFHDGTQCFQQWMSCGTCHPNNGRADGMNWDLLNDGIGNPKNAKSLLQADQTPPMMWRGVREDMIHAIQKGFFFQMRQPEPGDVEAVGVYLRSLVPEPSPYLDPNGNLTASAERGKGIFLSETTQCAKCHTGPLLTDQKQHDVGTRGLIDQAAIFDTPSLIEIYRTAPYLHDGSAASLQEVLVDKNRTDAHGKTCHLNQEQIEDLIQYLLSL
ncbi:MAG: c-type cytochrome [Pirellulales bacterium]|nr:c-type cytochrome [Pirellulales bacterium]